MGSSIKREPSSKILADLLMLESIEQVYYVDEDHTNSKFSIESLIGLINQSKSQSLFDEIRNLKGVPFSLDFDKEIIENEIYAQWENLTDEQKKLLITRVAKIVDKDWLINAEMPTTLGNLFSYANLRSMTPEEWDNEVDDILKSIPLGKKILVLFDEQTQYIKRGRDFIIHAKQKQYLNQLIPVLFTNGITDLSSELFERDKILQEEGGELDYSDFLPLAKSRGLKEKEFVDGIKKAILNRYCENIKEISIRIMKQAFDKAIDRLKKIDTYDFDNVVLKSSYQEGVWEAFTFYRIADILYQEEIFNGMLDQDYLSNFNGVIKKSKLISDLQTEINISQDPQYVSKLRLRNQELYQSSKTINSLFLPLDSGDIFRIYDSTGKGERFYILIGQECDMMLRVDNKTERNKNVTPGTRRAKVGMLLPIKVHDNLDANWVKEQNYALRYFTNTANKTGEVDFNNPIYVDLDLLELTAFSGDGKGVLTLKNKNKNLSNLSFSMEERYKLLKQNISKKIERYTSANIQRRRAKSRISRTMVQNQLPIFSFPDNSIVQVTFDRGVISLNLERYSRLKPSFAKQLLEKFTRYQSRHAELHDFAKEID